jgi:hypothetical protein
VTDLLTTALRELESDAPDADAVRAAVNQGIHRRARQRRLATVGAAACTVVALAAGAFAVANGFGADRPKPLDLASTSLVPVEAPPVRVLLKVPGSVREDAAQLWHLRGEETQVTYAFTELHQSGNPPPVTVGTGLEPPDSMYASPREVSATVQGKPATLRTYRSEELAELMWQASSGEWVWVAAESESETRQVAEDVTEEVVRARPPLAVGRMPKTFALAEAQWSTVPGDALVSTLKYCPEGTYGHEAECFVVTDPGSTELPGGYEFDESGYCRRGPVDDPPQTTFGPPLRVDGATVRLGTEGCHAAKLVDGRWLMVAAPAKAKLPPQEFARVAASIEVNR